MELNKVSNPYNGEIIETVERTGSKKAYDILDQAYNLFCDRSKWLPTHRRIEILEDTAELFKKNIEPFAELASAEGGKPISDSIIEMERAYNGIKVAVNTLYHFGGKEIPMNLTASSVNRIAFTMREPRGVVLAIGAFNHPMNMIIHQVIPAIAVGAPVIVKPASATPLSCINLMHTLYKSGLPEEWCRMITCNNQIVEKMVSDSRTAFLSFIGSAEIGWYLRSKLAPGASCCLEHGGAAPVIIDETADMKEVIPLIVKGGFYHAGQVCVSVQRIFIHESIINEFSDKIAKAASRLKTGNPLDETTEVGPLINTKEVERVDEWVKEAESSGAAVLCGGRKISESLYEPTVLLNPQDNTNVSRKEIFGPVICLYTYSKLDDAIQRANDVPFSFQAAIFTQNLDRAFKAVRRLNAMAVIVNDHTAFRVDWMPFGGNRASGIGVGGIGGSMHEMTLEKLMIIKSNSL